MSCVWCVRVCVISFRLRLRSCNNPPPGLSAEREARAALRPLRSCVPRAGVGRLVTSSDLQRGVPHNRITQSLNLSQSRVTRRPRTRQTRVTVSQSLSTRGGTYLVLNVLYPYEL